MSVLISAEDVGFSYNRAASEPVWAVEHVSMAVRRGEYVAVLGRNGSGKSTFARLLNGLELPAYGRVCTAGYDTADDAHVQAVRQVCGMVFQNPDNQIVGTTVEEDVAFGPENLGIPLPALADRVRQALTAVGLADRADVPPAMLSGGQKQKLAIAGVLAMEPDAVILDEATAMLDPVSRRELMRLVLELRDSRQLTVLNITHHMDEVLQADRVLVMADGHVLLEGRPAEIFRHVQEIRHIGLDVPVHTALADRLSRQLSVQQPAGAPTAAASAGGSAAGTVAGFDSTAGSVGGSGAGTPAGTAAGFAGVDLAARPDLADPDQAEAWIRRLLRSASADQLRRAAAVFRDASRPPGDAAIGEAVGGRTAATEAAAGETVIQVSHLSYTYDDGSGVRTEALRDLSFEVRRGEIFGIMGHTGSGKSTLIQHFNGLLRRQSGVLKVLDCDLSQTGDIRQLRRHVGLLFQYPEHQLFAETCAEDIGYGPTRLGLAPDQVCEKVMQAAAVVGLDPAVLEQSPFELSGGQKRRVAIAGILAMEPDVLVLDEPAAGLDPAGREEIFRYIEALRSTGATVVLVSHNMDELARLADRILLLDHGRQAACGTPDEIFRQPDVLAACQVTEPILVSFLKRFVSDYPALDPYQYSEADALAALIAAATPDEGAGQPAVIGGQSAEGQTANGQAIGSGQAVAE